MSADFNSETVLSALAVLADGLTRLLEISQGHRAQAEQMGFSPTAAEQMALDCHAALMQLLVANSGGKT